MAFYPGAGDRGNAGGFDLKLAFNAVKELVAADRFAVQRRLAHSFE